MKDLTVGVVQLAAEEVWRDAGAAGRNVAQIVDRYLEVADECDLVVMPELAASGYIPLKGYDQAKKHVMAEAANLTWESLVPSIAEATTGHRATLVVGKLEPSTMRNEMFNASCMFEGGELIAVHRKMHLPVEENHYFVPGDRVAVADSRLGRIGLLVCYDMMFPEAPRLASLQGAELLCVISNWLDIANLRDLGRILPPARALEGQMHVVFVNGVGELEARGRRWSLYGRSSIVAATGEVRATAGAGSETVIAQLAEADLVAASSVFPFLRDRRPDAYAPLSASREMYAATTTRTP